MNHQVKIVLFAVVGGILLTLVTGPFENMPGLLLGATHYGYPLAWLTRLIIAPEYFPWRIRPLELIADVVIWAAIVWVTLFVIARIRK